MIFSKQYIQYGPLVQPYYISSEGVQLLNYGFKWSWTLDPWFNHITYLVKGFNCLLLNYGFSWKLTLELWMLVWFNYRADPRLLADPTFYEVYKENKES